MQLIDHRRAICTMPSGGPFLAGVLEGARIPLHSSIRTVLSYYSTWGKRVLNIRLSSRMFLPHRSCMDKVDGVPIGKHPLVAQWILGDRLLNPPQHSLVLP